ncbi:MAG: ATP-dependent DNA helicase RecG [Chitinophagales bacterium]
MFNFHPNFKQITTLMHAKASSILDTSIAYLKGVGPAKAALLQKELQVFTFADLLRHYPFRYIDKTQLNRIDDIHPESQYIQVKGKIISKEIIGEKHAKRLVAVLYDGSQFLDLVWFQGIAYMEKYLVLQKEYLVFGKPNFFKGKPSIPHPDLELLSDEPITFANRLLPVYGVTEKLKARNITSKTLAKLIQTLLEQVQESDIPEFLPEEILQRRQLVRRYHALKNIHQPESEFAIQPAQIRLKFDEFFILQIRLLRMKARNRKLQGFVFDTVGDNFNTFFHEKLPFELTNAQKNVLREIRRDTLSRQQMNRLLQGDVGSGKTVVALMAMLIATDNGFQACIMAPTEILAQQHFQSLQEYLTDLHVNIALLTGSVKGKARKQILADLAAGSLHLLVGTHALIEDAVQFQNLGLVIIDEQHRFGVAQRAKLWRKNDTPPHILVMTATPIPRTLALTLYGDLDISVIDELPAGRKAIVTAHRYDNRRLEVFGFVREEIAKGRQVYMVYPLIEESEKLDLKNLVDGFESISREFPLPEYRVSMVHGKMKADEKEFEMQRFVRGETQIMVATTVIEVGVNVPNASVMIIENAERFGLSQLHQLRGRVGRGAEQSYCILMTGHKLSADARKRIKTMVATNNGFIIAEKDMELRGPGDLEGTRQSGLLNFKLASISADRAILEQAREEAAQIIEKDPNLETPLHLHLRTYLIAETQRQGGLWSRIS